MIVKLSKRALREEAERLEAVEIYGRKTNIYNYENSRYKLCKERGATYEGIAYSAGAYGNTGRIDRIMKPNGATIEYIFYTE